MDTLSKVRMNAKEFEELRIRMNANPMGRDPYPPPIQLIKEGSSKINNLEVYLPLKVAKARHVVKKKVPRDMSLLQLSPPLLAVNPWSYGPCVFPGQLCSKSNSRRLVMRGKTPAIIKSQESLDFVEDFVKAFKDPNRPAYEDDVCLVVKAHYEDRRRDLDIALLQDALQAAGIIKNDRQVIEIHAIRRINKEKPRTWFRLCLPTGEQLWHE